MPSFSESDRAELHKWLYGDRLLKHAGWRDFAFINEVDKKPPVVYTTLLEVYTKNWGCQVHIYPGGRLYWRVNHCWN
jgi:hypothetical protein